jgi:spermidine synthase
MRREVILGSTVAFIASFCTLVIELVANRILAPYVGVSLYSWTSIIGVVLAGISVGAYLGGLLADRFPRPSTLGWLLFFSGLTALAIPLLADTVGDGGFLKNPVGDFRTSLMLRVLITTAVIFFIPALILGMISPVVVKLTVNDLEKTGNTVGKIYAFSTVGSILGTFATGFFLIEALGTRTLLYSVGAVLIICAPIFGGLLAGRRGGAREAVVVASLIVLAGTLGTLWTFREAVARPYFVYINPYTYDFGVYPMVSSHNFFKESDYYTLKVFKEEYHGDEGRTLVLDHLIHSFTNLNDPFYLKYEYLRIYEELVAWHRSTRTNADRFLFVGGGGYTLPRYFDHAYADAQIDVAEIDPWVSKVAHEQLGIIDTRIKTYNMDARWFVMNREELTHTSEKYDFIFGDAFNDLSIPYHLTTKEFNLHLRNCMKDDGLLMALVIDNVSKGQFIPTYIRTLQEAVDRGNVYLIVFHSADIDAIECHTCIIVASPTKLDMDDFTKFMEKRLARQKGVTSATGAVAQGCSGLDLLAIEGMTKLNPSRNTSRVIPMDRLKQWMATRKKVTGREPIVLTDDHAPVDNLVAPMFEERFGFKKPEDR